MTSVALQPLTESVLNPELLAFLKSSKPDVSHLSDLVYYTPVDSIDALPGHLNDTVKATKPWPEDNAIADTSSLRSVVNALETIDPKKVSSLPGMWNAARDAGKAIFAVQHAMIIGEGPLTADGKRTMSARQAAYVDRIMRYVEASLDAAIPFEPMSSEKVIADITQMVDTMVDTNQTAQQSQLIAQLFQTLTMISVSLSDDANAGTTSASAAAAAGSAAPSSTTVAAQLQAAGVPPDNMSKFFAAAVAHVIDAFRMSVTDQDLIDWLFPDAVAEAYVYIALGPYLRLRYLGTFVPGSWNVRQRQGASFYDSRYAQLLIMNSMRAAVLSVVRVPDLPASDVAALTTLGGAIQISVTSKSEKEVGGEALKSMYGEVAKMSEQARNGSKQLSETSSLFETRRSKVQVLQDAAFQADLRAKRAYTSLMLWLAAYVVSLIIAIILILTNKLEGFLLLFGVTSAILGLSLILYMAQWAVKRVHVSVD